MAQNILRGQIIGIREPCQQLDQGIISFLGKGTIRRLVTSFNGNRIKIPGLHRISNLIQGNTLDDLAVISNDEMC